MSGLPEELILDANDEARRLWEASLAARQRPDDLVAICEALDLGLRVVEILVLHRLQAAKAQFPATIVAQLDLPDPELAVERDAVGARHSLHFTEIIDLLSEESLECVSPGLHRGWEDRRFSCRRSRQTATSEIGLTLDAGCQRRLLVLSAYRNRIFRDPPPVRIRPAEILAGFDDLDRVVTHLLPAG